MKSKLFLIFALCGVTSLCFAVDQVVEEIIARVNDAIITRSDLQHEKEQLLQNDQQEGADSARVSEDEKNLLRDLIDQRLLLDKANELGVNVDNEVIRQLDDMRKKMGLGSMEELEKAAEQQGISFADYKQNIKEKLLTQAIIEHEVGQKVSTGTPEEIKQFYDAHQKELTREEQVRLSEILISPNPEALRQAEQQAEQAAQNKKGDQQVQPPPPPEPTQEEIAAAEKKAQTVEAELKGGAKFDELAKKVSDGPTAKNGGDLGYFKRGVLAKELEDKTFAMKAGDISEPILTKQGYVILKVSEHVKGGVPPLKDVEPQIKDAIYTKNIQPLLREYLTKLREEAYIDIKPGYIDSGASPNETKPVIATGPGTKGGSAKPGKKKKLGIF
ncbi:MAG TPA: peptidylprolyl isomerase [Terriglobales bacterium]|nr:peptidylprolyl isomerase [Terriglobales bacterium]